MDEDVDISQPKEISQETADAVSAMAQEFPNRGEVATIALQAMPQSIAQMDDSDRIESGETSAGNVLMRSTRAFWGKVASKINDLVGSFTFKGGDYIDVTPSTNATTGEHTILIENKGVTNIAGITGAVGVTTPTGDGVSVAKNGQNIELRNTGVKKVTGASGVSVSPETGDAVISANRYVDGPSGHYPNEKYSFVEFIVQKKPYRAGDWGGNVDQSVTDYDTDDWWNATDTAWLVGRFVTVDATGTQKVRTRNIPISRAASVTPASGYGSYIDVVVDVSWNPATATLIQTKQRISFTSGLCQTPSATAPFDITTASECA